MVTMTTILIILGRNDSNEMETNQDVVEDAENICNYNIADDDECKNDDMDDGDNISYT